MRDDERKIIRQKITEDTGPYHSISATFEAERFSGDPLLDTYVQLDVPRFGITWNDKEKLLKELAEVIAKYQI